MSAVRSSYEVDNRPYGCKYVIRDYGDYKTISKVLWKNGNWDLTTRIDEYIIWRSPIARQT